MKRSLWLAAIFGILCMTSSFAQEAEEDEVVEDLPTADPDIGSSREGSRTDDEVVEREEEAIKLDGLSVAQMKEMREQAEKHAFQAEVNKMMKLIINSLYRNKEIFLRELISNASDALDKIRFLSLTDKSALDTTEELSIKIKSDPENRMIHVIDTGIGMTRKELALNLGTIAKSGTGDFLQKLEEANSAADAKDLIGQFGVGFYSSFLVADRVIVTSKSNEDSQHIWESDASEFSIAEDPRGNTLLRGTQITLVLKDEAKEFLETSKLKDLIKKYSQFINFPIYLWDSRTEEVEEPIEEDEEPSEPPVEEEKEEEEAAVEEEETEEEKPKTKKVSKTVWDWVLMNDSKPIWLRNPKEVPDEDYEAFYKSFSKDSETPLAKVHFTAEGEVTFKAILFVAKSAPSDLYSNYSGKLKDRMKLYVRRVYITDEFDDMLPKYLRFISGVVDSDDLPLNVSRETLQQHKLLMVIKKKIVRKALDMFKKMDEETYKRFWGEYGTSMKLGVMEDPTNKSKLAKLLRFQSSNDEEELTSLEDYVERMKEKQESIFFVAGTSRSELEKSPFVERALRREYEVLYFTEPVDEYTIQHLAEFDGKKFQNLAKEGMTFGDEGEKQKEHFQSLEENFKPLTEWFKDKALSEQIEKAVISNRLTDSPCALVASQYGWSANMERIMKSQAYAKQNDPMSDYYLKQKKTLEINPYHPLINELKNRVESDEEDKTALDTANLLYETAVLRSGFTLQDSAEFAGRIERMMKLSLGVDPDAEVDYVEIADQEEEAEEDEEEEVSDGEEEEVDGGEEVASDETEAVPEAPTEEAPTESRDEL